MGSAALVYTITDDSLVQQAEQIENANVQTAVKVKKRAKEPDSDVDGEYVLWINNRMVNTYSDTEGLKSYVATEENSYVTLRGKAKPIFEQDKQYVVETKVDTKQFGDINEALAYARQNKNIEAVVTFSSNDKIIWSYDDKLKSSVTINVENLIQSPELVNGSEVTSLAMLLTAGGVQVDKQELARNLVVDTYNENGKGSPYYGYVGDMYSETESYGVYNQPIFNLLQSYIYNYAVNVTGCDFSLVERFLNKGYPVWVMTTESFDELKESEFVTYDTSFGEVTVTSKSQSVLVTGYDSNFIYFNDPLGNKTKATRQSFIKSFEQMGNQAVSYTVR